jgi:nitrite reductase/ring-hydroxylating ferredoxin subunit
VSDERRNSTVAQDLPATDGTAAPSSPVTRRHRVGSVDDFPEGTHRVVDVGGRAVGIFNIAGTLYALPNVCAHQAGPLCEAKQVTGTLASSPSSDWDLEWVHDGEIITCPWHGLEYHVPSGRCLAYSHVRLRRFPVVVEAGSVSIDLPRALGAAAR